MYAKWIGDICSFLLFIAYVASCRQASCLFLTYALRMQCSVTHLFMIDICSFLLCTAYVASSRQASCLFLTHALSMQCSVTHLFHDTLKNAFLFNRFTTQNAVAVQPVPITNPFGTLPAMPQVSFGRAGTTPSVQYGISTMPVTINCPEFVYSRVSLIFYFFVFLM